MPEQSAPGLRRTMGLADVAAYFVVASTNLQWLPQAASSGASSLAMWVLGGLAMFLPLSIVVIYLSSHYPDEGGMYVWSKRAFGPFAGFMTGWTYWTATMPYFPALMYFTAGNALFVSGGNGGALATSPAYFVMFALGGVALAVVVNVLGLSVGKWLTNIGGACRWTITLLLIALGAYAWSRFGPATSFTAKSLTPGFEIRDVRKPKPHARKFNQSATIIDRQTAADVDHDFAAVDLKIPSVDDARFHEAILDAFVIHQVLRRLGTSRPGEIRGAAND